MSTAASLAPLTAAASPVPDRRPIGSGPALSSAALLAVPLPVRGGQIAWRDGAGPLAFVPVRGVELHGPVHRQSARAYVATRTTRTLHLSRDGRWYVWADPHSVNPSDAAAARARLSVATTPTEPPR